MQQSVYFCYAVYSSQMNMFRLFEIVFAGSAYRQELHGFRGRIL